MNENNRKAVGGLTWKFLERLAYQIISFAVTLVIARLLTPGEYGLVAIVLAVVTILQVFVDSGMGTALVQMKNAEEKDFSTVFLFNIVISIVLYVIIFFGAPLISLFYDKDLNNVIRVLGIIIIIFGVKNIYQAYISRNLLFRKAFIGSFIGIVCGGVSGILFAYYGFGVWSLVFQQLITEIICTVVFIFIAKWRPKLAFSKKSFKASFGFGWKLLVSSLVDSVYNNVRQLLIAKFYTTDDLAYYSKGEQFPSALVSSINSSMNTVLLPVMSQRQDNKAEVKKVVRTMIRNSSYILWPMMIGLFVVADKVVELLLTEAWLPVVPFIRVFCFAYCLQPLQTTNLSAMKSLGRSDLCLKLEIIKKSIGIALVIGSIYFGPMVIAISSVVYAVIASIINAFPNRKLINYSYLEQIKDISIFVLLSALMGGAVYLIGLIPIVSWAVLIIQIISGILVYVLLSYIFKIDSFYLILGMIKSLMFSKHKKQSIMRKFIKKIYLAVKKTIDSIRNNFQRKNFPKRIKANKIKIKSNLEKRKVLNILFILQYPEMWNSVKSIYGSMKADERFSVKVLAVPKRIRSSLFKTRFMTENEAYNFCLSENICAINARDKGRWFHVKDLASDYIFIQRPYNSFMPKEYSLYRLSKLGLLCYVPYGYEFVNGIHLEIEYNQDLMNSLYMEFAENSETFNYFLDKCKNNLSEKIRKIYDLGYPRFDLIKRSGISNDLSKTVLWLPRWSLDEKNDRSYFLDYFEVLFKFFNENRQHKLIIRPHPLMFNNFIETGRLSKEQVDEIKDRITKSDNIAFDNNKDYLKTFEMSDLLISDFTSLLIEYYLTSKPIIYCGETKSFNIIGQIMAQSFYRITNRDELITSINNLLSESGNEINLTESSKLKELLKGNYIVGQKIADIIYNDAQNK